MLLFKKERNIIKIFDAIMHINIVTSMAVVGGTTMKIFEEQAASNSSYSNGPTSRIGILIILHWLWINLAYSGLYPMIFVVFLGI